MSIWEDIYILVVKNAISISIIIPISLSHHHVSQRTVTKLNHSVGTKIADESTKKWKALLAHAFP